MTYVTVVILGFSFLPLFTQLCVCVCICFCRVALDRAAVLLRMKREILRLDNVWGVGGGQRPVKHLIKEVKSQQTRPPSDA